MSHLVPTEVFFLSTFSGIGSLAACPILKGYWHELAAGAVAILSFCVAALALAVAVYS